MPLLTRFSRDVARIAIVTAFCAAIAALVVYIVASLAEERGQWLTGDFAHDSLPALQAGSGGAIWEMWRVEQQPLMLPLGLLLQLPGFIVGGHLGFERLHLPAAFSGLLIASLGLAYASTVGRRGWRALCETILLVAAVALTPLSIEAVQWAHAEETIGALLLVSALVSAGRDRWVAAAVMFGLAAAVKQPFLFAAPTLLAMFPNGRRLRLVAVAAGVWTAVTAPVLTPHLGAFLGVNTAVSTATGAVYDLSVFTAFGLTDYMSVGKPLAAVVAVILPALFAARNGWRLTPLQGSATLVIVLLWRCALDPFNIGYYMAPAAAAVIAADWLAWQTGQHPLLRVSAIRRLGIVLPLIGVGLAVVLHQALGGWHIAALADRLFGDSDGRPYIFVVMLVSALALPIALGARVHVTRARLRLYATAGLAAVALVTLSQFSIGDPPEHDFVAPDGYRTMSPRQAAAGTSMVYWLGGDPAALRFQYLAAPTDPRQRRTVALASYDTGHGSSVGISVFTRQADSADAATRRVIAECAAGECPEQTTVTSTPIGRGLLKQNRGAWDAVVPVKDGSVFVSALGDVEASGVLAQLSAVPPVG